MILYEILTGRQVFDHSTVVEVMMAHISEAREELGVPVLPREFTALVKSCLAKSAADRRQKMTDISQQLEAGATSSVGALAPVLAMQGEGWGGRPAMDACPNFAAAHATLGTAQAFTRRTRSCDSVPSRSIAIGPALSMRALISHSPQWPNRAISAR